MTNATRLSIPSILCGSALAACLAACGGTDGGRRDAGVRDSAGIRIVENGTALDTCAVSEEPTLDIGLVEGPAEYQLYRVMDAAMLSDGRIAVVNQGSDQVRVFGADGTFDHAFGGRGGGPGEFNDVFLLWVAAGDTLVVGDYRPWRFSIFTPEGEFARAVVPRPEYVNTPESVAPLSDGSYVISQTCCAVGIEPGQWVEQHHDVVHHGADGSLIDTLAVLPYGRRGWLDVEIRFMGSPLFEARSHVASQGNRVVIGRGLERELEVYELAAAGTARGGNAGFDMSHPSDLIRWTGRDRTVTPEDIETSRQAQREEWASYDDPVFRRAGERMAASDRPVADRFPAHGSIEFGREGDIWVHGYPRPGEDDPGWLVFDSEGRLECRAWLPFANTWDAYEIGDDYVLGKMTDELEVEHVVRFAFSRP